MSSAGWVLVGLLLISPFLDASEVKDESSQITGRQRRSIMNLKDMVAAVTGRNGLDFIAYGNWCGLGGSGHPVDPIDECCQNHDICYNVTKKGVCRDEGEKGVYQLEYKWRLAGDETAVCDDDDNQCKMTICMCDVIISNCLKSNIEFYDSRNQRDVSLFDLFQEADYIIS